MFLSHNSNSLVDDTFENFLLLETKLIRILQVNGFPPTSDLPLCRHISAHQWVLPFSTQHLAGLCGNSVGSIFFTFAVLSA